MDTAQPAITTLTALRCWVQGRRVYLEINARRLVSFPASKYKILENAPQSELEKIQLQGDGRTIQWESLDEEISVDDVANNRFFHTPKSVVP